MADIEGGRMVYFDPESRTYVDPATGNRASIEVAHWQDPQIGVELHWAGKRFFFDATLTGSPQGARTFRVLSSRYFEPVRAYWVPFSGSDEALAALWPFIAAWSMRVWKGDVTGLEDGRGNLPTLEEALRPPGQEALNELVRRSRNRPV